MRVLHLTPELPRWPGGTGGSTRQFHLLKRLAELGHEVTVVAPVADDQRNSLPGLEAAGIATSTVDRPTSRVRETLGALRSRPSLVTSAASSPVLAWQVGVFWATLRPVAQRALEEVRPDVLSVEHDNAARWPADLEGPPPAVLTLQNVGWHYYENRAKAASGATAAALRLEARRFRRHDARHFGLYRTLVAMSERDRLDLGAVTQVPVEVVPNGVATDQFSPAPPAAGDRTLLFTGTLSHPPNAEGICWFADNAWPRVRAVVPDARLVVVGHDPPRRVSALSGRDGVEVIGPVPDMAPWFERATAVVVPLLSGGGTRLKVLEAMANGRAVASTRVGCEGLDLKPERDILVADGADDLAAACMRLLEDPELRETLAAAGRGVVEQLYDWRMLGDRLAAVFEAAAGGARIPSTPG